MNPGALSDMNGFAPLLNGCYGSVSTYNNGFGGTTSFAGGDILSAYMFRQVDGTVRFLGFRKQNIDEYNSSGTRTNRGTSYNVSTAGWSAAAWGNQIIACNYLDATQSSTGAGFTALGGSSPKARYVAANLNFVMLADTDDSGSNVQADRVWWCAIQDPTSWSPSIATQAGTIRLLDAPGPLRQIQAYRDTFVAFKDNAIWVGEYVGPPYVFAWRMVSNRVGCIAPKSVVELDGKLYFMHTSGFYQFDGQNISLIGNPVIQTFLTECNYVNTFYGGTIPGFQTSYPVSATMATADDLEGIVWFANSYLLDPVNHRTFCYGYNVRNGKWSRCVMPTAAASSSSPPTFVQTTSADAQAFKSIQTARFFYMQNIDNVTGAFIYAAYPGINAAATFTTGVMGALDQSQTTIRVYPRMLIGSTALGGSDIANVTGYSTENKIVTVFPTSANIAANAEFQAWDLFCNSRYRQYSFTTTTKQLLAGLSVVAQDRR